MLANFLLSSPSDQTGRMVQEAMKDYFLLEAEKDASESIGGHIFGNGLDEQNKRLDIALKKRQLQMLGPQDTEKYNDTSANKVLSSLGITWAKDLQPPAARAGIAASQDAGFLSKFKAFGMGAVDAKELSNGSSSALGLINSSLHSGGSPSNWARIASRF